MKNISTLAHLIRSLPIIYFNFCRSKSATFLNTGSSRSHAVYTITLDRSNGEGVFDQSVAFQLVDLAGAERG